MVETKSDDKRPIQSGVKPLQTLSYKSKDAEWRKQNVEYFIHNASFAIDAKQGEGLDRVASWYDIYNNKIDEKLFNYVTNPLNAKTDIYKKFPARIRPYNIIRPTIDLLIGEYSKRPFKFDVVNLDGEGVINSYTDAKYETFKANITKRIVAEIEKATGQPVTEENLPNPKLVMDDMNTNYKDLKAIKGYKALRIIEAEQKLREKLKDMFKDWVIAGDVCSIKTVKRSDIEYDRLSSLWTSVNKSPQVKNYEDGSDAVAKFRVTVADLVDMFYEDLQETHLKRLEQDEDTYRRGLFTHFSTNIGQNKGDSYLDKVDLYYTTWKSRKKIGFLDYFDPLTGEPQSMEIDEDYPVDKAVGESVEWMWVNEVWEGWRVNDDLYLGIQPVAVQRNEMNNFSSCKLPINGRKFSDTESANVSVLSLGIPYQIMYIILNYRIELLIAKSKGKIALLDKNTINGDASTGGDEKTFYYAEALGYMLLDRSADDVDRSWNQYTTLDMDLFSSIEQLIRLAQFYKDSWEELLGISRQRKGAINSSDGLGASQEAIFRSSVISDIIFSTFDEFVESELQGLLDLSKFAWVDGKLGYHRSDDGRMELFSIDPEDYVTSSLGVFVELMSSLEPKLQLMREQINAISQRKEVKLSTIADLVFTDSYAELKAKLRKAEEIESEVIRQSAESEQAAKKEIEELKKEYAIFQNYLDIEKQERDWDRRDNNEYIKGEVSQGLAGEGTTIDIGGIEQRANDRLNNMEKTMTDRMKIYSAERIAKMQDETEQKKIAASLKNKVAGEK